MEEISDVFITDYIPTIYTTPCQMQYQQNGKLQNYDIFAERNGVLIILYNKTNDSLVLVKQFRPSVYLSCVPQSERTGSIDTVKYPPALGITLEFCAGLEDKNMPSERVAQEEILEECGYEVALSQLEKVTVFKNLTETTGAKTTVYYCEVTDEMRVGSGGGVDDEIIDVIEMPVGKVRDYIGQTSVNSPMNFMWGVYWFFTHKYNR